MYEGALLTLRITVSIAIFRPAQTRRPSFAGMSLAGSETDLPGVARSRLLIRERA